ncbi:MAG: L,D-transpeptidase family protein [Fimbriimonadales bacterium]
MGALVNRVFALAVVVAVIASVALHVKGLLRAGVVPERTVSEALAEFGPAAKRQFASICRKNNIPWPPKRIYLLAFKKERQLEMWAGARTGAYVFLAEYPILGISGKQGPKLKEGDRQVPEGFYRISALNPSSRYHLSLRVDYPNADDVKFAAIPRGQMGGDIYVHGSNVSIGCLAMGDDAIEEIFCLVAWAKDRKIIIGPVDLRTKRVADDPRKLYPRLKKTLKKFPR